jgi:hypothetical protein
MEVIEADRETLSDVLEEAILASVLVRAMGYGGTYGWI